MSKLDKTINTIVVLGKNKEYKEIIKSDIKILMYEILNDSMLEYIASKKRLASDLSAIFIEKVEKL